MTFLLTKHLKCLSHLVWLPLFNLFTAVYKVTPAVSQTLKSSLSFQYISPLLLLVSSIFPLYCCCSVSKSYSTLCDSMHNRLPVLHHLLDSNQTHVHWISDAIQPSHPLLLPTPPALSVSQHQGLFQWVSSSHQVAKVPLYPCPM